MGLPSPVPERNFFESEAKQEIVAAAVAGLGLIFQAIVTLREKANPDAVQRLAQALYGPDTPSELRAIATKPVGVDGLQIAGWLLTLGGVLLLFFFKHQRAKKKDEAENQARNPDGLRGAAMVLYSILKASLGFPNDDGTLRVAVYRITPAPAGGQSELEQIIDYVGTQQPGGKARRMPISVGIVGLAVRVGKPQIANRQGEDDNAYVEELITTWGYTREQAATMSMDRRSFMAVPIVNHKSQVLGAVFADSSIQDAFDGQEENLIAATLGFAAYVEERFK